MKAWTRAKRIALIKTLNPTWQDLADGWGQKVELQIPRFARDDNKFADDMKHDDDMKSVKAEFNEKFESGDEKRFESKQAPSPLCDKVRALQNLE